MPGKDGICAARRHPRRWASHIPVVMISGQANIEMAVRATRLGAVDFLEKPLSTDKLLLTVDNVLRLKRLEEENRQLRQRVGKHEIVLAGEAMRRVMAQVERVAASETRVCILGETGTGKELIARALHERSPRRDGPFVTLNCAAVPAELIESELFGHEKGSFTGAAARHIGKFEQAHARHAVPRRDRRHAAGDAGQAAARARGERGRARRRRPAHRRSTCAWWWPRIATSKSWSRHGVVPPGPVPSHLRFPAAPAAAARAPGRHSGAGGAFRAAACGAERLEAETGRRRRPSPSWSAIRWPGNVRELRNVVERLLLLAGDEVQVGDVRLALPQRAAGDGRRCRLDGDRHAGRARGELRARSDAGRTEAEQPAHDRTPRGRWGWSAAIFTRSASSWGSTCARCAKGKGIDAVGAN